MDFMTWYNQLRKPSWTPEPSVIGTIWTILYPVIFVVNGYVLYEAVKGRISWWVALPFVINLIANFAFTPIQFGLKNLPLSTVDISIIWLTIVWAMIAIWPHAKWVTVAFVPYLLWVTTASVLQFSITFMNR